MQLKLFVKENCPGCPEAFAVCSGFDGLHVFDVSDVDGLAEAALHGVSATPSVLVVDADGREVAAWRGEVPLRDALRALLVN